MTKTPEVYVYVLSCTEYNDTEVVGVFFTLPAAKDAAAAYWAQRLGPHYGFEVWRDWETLRFGTEEHFQHNAKSSRISTVNKLGVQA